MIKFYYDEKQRFPIWINKNMVVFVEPDKTDERYTRISLVTGYVVVSGVLEKVVEDLEKQE